MVNLISQKYIDIFNCSCLTTTEFFFKTYHFCMKLVQHNAYLINTVGILTPVHQSPHCWIMMTSSNGNIFHVTGPLCGDSPVPGEAGDLPVPVEFPSQKPVTQSLDVSFNPHLNKRLTKHWARQHLFQHQYITSQKLYLKQTLPVEKSSYMVTQWNKIISRLSILSSLRWLISFKYSSVMASYVACFLDLNSGLCFTFVVSTLCGKSCYKGLW